ncbi:hypothetical protein DSECCO2_625110 [anaerobic digester metagenome]|jgi:hypothetical protein
MTAADLRRRVDRLEAGEDLAAAGAIVIYQPGETDEEIRARIPPGAETVIFLPDNGRDRPAAGERLS